MKIAIASDHGGFSLKEEIIRSLRARNLDIVDLGNHGTESVDYPDYALKVAELVSEGKAERGILLCGTGIGMSIVANKFKGVRAAVVMDDYTARMSREHNDANILCLGGRVQKPKQAVALVRIWLETSFEGGRHENRLEKIRKIEGKNLR